MKRLRHVLKWVGIAVGAAIVIFLIFNAFFVGSIGTQLESRLIALRHAGNPVQLADLAHEPIPPEKNADVFLRRAADDLDAMQKELTAHFPDKGYPTSPASPTDQAKLEKLFTAYPKVIALVEQAADCPDNDPQLDTTPPTSRFLESYYDITGRHRLLARVLRARSVWLLSKGRRDDALSTQLLLLRLTRHWRTEPLLPAYLVTTVCELLAMENVNQIMQSGPISPSARQALDSELILHDSMVGYEWAMRSERAFSLSSMREIPGAGFWLARGFQNDVMIHLIDLYDRYLRDAAHPYAETDSAQTNANLSSWAWNPYEVLVTLLDRSLSSCREPAERTRALSRSLRILNAIQAREPQGGDWVPKLAELGLPQEATIDPFNSQPLHFKKVHEGWTVYSVGRNRIDDGGILDYKHDIGAGPIAPQEVGTKP